MAKTIHILVFQCHWSCPVARRSSGICYKIERNVESIETTTTGSAYYNVDPSSFAICFWLTRCRNPSVISDHLISVRAKFRARISFSWSSSAVFLPSPPRSDFTSILIGSAIAAVDRPSASPSLYPSLASIANPLLSDVIAWLKPSSRRSRSTTCNGFCTLRCSSSIRFFRATISFWREVIRFVTRPGRTSSTLRRNKCKQKLMGNSMQRLKFCDIITLLLEMRPTCNLLLLLKTFYFWTNYCFCLKTQKCTNNLIFGSDKRFDKRQTVKTTQNELIRFDWGEHFINWSDSSTQLPNTHVLFSLHCRCDANWNYSNLLNLEHFASNKLWEKNRKMGVNIEIGLTLPPIPFAYEYFF